MFCQRRWPESAGPASWLVGELRELKDGSKLSWIPVSDIKKFEPNRSSSVKEGFGSSFNLRNEIES